MSDLKKCRFLKCGGEADLMHRAPLLTVLVFYVSCKKCGIQTRDFAKPDEARGFWNAPEEQIQHRPLVEMGEAYAEWRASYDGEGSQVSDAKWQRVDEAYKALFADRHDTPEGINPETKACPKCGSAKVGNAAFDFTCFSCSHTWIVGEPEWARRSRLEREKNAPADTSEESEMCQQCGWAGGWYEEAVNREYGHEESTWVQCPSCEGRGHKGQK